LGQKNVTVQGNLNEILTTNGDDSFSVIGNENSIESTGGNNEVDFRGDSNTYQGGEDIDAVRITGSSNTAKGGNESDTFVILSGTNNIIDGEAGERNTIINEGETTTFSNVVDITPNPLELSIKVDTGSSADSFIYTEVSFNLYDFKLDLSSADKALRGLEDINKLISDVDSQLLSIGSTINRLESVLEAQNIKLQNLISTRSTLRDADLGDVSADYIKHQILQQASATLLATTRELKKENVLGLLYGL
jgi:flagellin-like hook-associated protein FlgL